MNHHQAVTILSRVTFKDWAFHVGRSEAAELFLQVRFTEHDPDTGQLELQHGRKWVISEHCTPSELVQTAFKAVSTALEHEAREAFTYRGARIFGPHFDVEQLVCLATYAGPSVARQPSEAWERPPCTNT